MTTDNIITSFTGDFTFLSNFYMSPFTLSGNSYETVEHFYQSRKTLNEDQSMEIIYADTPGKAKRLGAKCDIRANWEEIKMDVMRTGLMLKFRDHELRQKLIATNPSLIVEGNHWGDTFWGVCDGIGQNHLGKLLMEIRNDCIHEINNNFDKLPI